MWLLIMWLLATACNLSAVEHAIEVSYDAEHPLMLLDTIEVERYS